MSKEAFILDGNLFVVSKSRCGDHQTPGAPPGHTAVVVTQDEVDEWRAGGGKYHPRPAQGEELYRWKYIDGALVEQGDPRPTATWSQETVEVTVGQAAKPVTLTLSVRTDGRVDLDFGHRTVWASFAKGAASIPVTPSERGGEAGTFRYTSCAGYRMTNSLTVTVVDATRPTGARNELA